MADKTIVLKNSNEDSKSKRSTLTPRKCAKTPVVTSPFKREGSFHSRCLTSKSPSKDIFKVPTPKFARPPKCPDNSSLLSPSRKSVSLTDLSPSSKRGKQQTDRPADASSLLDNSQKYSIKNMSKKFDCVNGNCDNDTKTEDRKLCDAGRIVCNMLTINAWRRKKEETVQLNQIIDDLNQQVNHLQIQIVVLRRLLDTENSRVGKLTTEVQQIKIQADERNQECENLKKEKEKVDKEVERIKEMYENRLVSEKNVRNDLDTVRHQLEALEAQISRDREKLLKLREDKKILLEKISISEKIATENKKKADENRSIIDELQLKLAAQFSLMTLAEQEKKELEQKYETSLEEQCRLKSVIKSFKQEEKVNEMEKHNLENKVIDLDRALRRVEAEYDLALSKVNDLQSCITQQSDYNNWGGRVLQMAGNIVRTPQTIYRSLSFL